MTSVSSELRSRIMRSVKRAHTKPEVVVRKCMHVLGLRFRVNRRDLPGTPDIVLPKYRTIVFVHGCFWHRHEGCRYATTPKSRQECWLPKFSVNIERDRRKENELKELGWRVIVLWECETRNEILLVDRLKREFNLP